MLSIDYCFLHSYINLLISLHLAPSWLQVGGWENVQSAKSSHKDIGEEGGAGEGSISAARWRISCCCWEMITVRGTTANINKIIKNPIVLEWLGELTSSSALFKKLILNLA